MNIYQQIQRLIQYGLQKKLIAHEDIDYVRNQLLAILQLDEFKAVKTSEDELNSPREILDGMLDWAFERGLLENNSVTYRDLLDTKLMDCLMPRPSEVIREFKKRYNQNREDATDYFYQLSKDSNYIRRDRIAKNKHWYSETEYGALEITINLSKPEKDPQAIAAAKSLKQADYPLCLLCKENVGYQGRVNHPARQNHRIIPVTLQGEQWYIQYSPYVYYNEHAIVFSGEHTPMKISEQGFDRLLAFVEQYPHYFVGTNADLPIVGGSILTHDHFQGGHHDFPMAVAEVEESFDFAKEKGISVGIVKWPMSVIRLSGSNPHELSAQATEILNAWRVYSDTEVGIYPFTNEEPHNTITPIARKQGENFELDLVLRNNRTSDSHPLGIFHPHAEVHHIKKENIGLIEVMGLAVLPGRLQEEMNMLAAYLVHNDLNAIQADSQIAKHVDWAEQVVQKHKNLNEQNVHDILQSEIGKVFSTVLEHAGVFKRNEAGKAGFKRFIQHIENNNKH